MKSILIFSLALIVSCNLTAQSVNLKYNLEKNKIYRMKSVTEQDISQTMNGDQRSSTVKNIVVLSLKMTSSDANLISADVKFDSIVFLFNMPGMSMDVNSSKSGSVSSEDPSTVMNYFLNKMSKTVFNIKMTYSGGVTEITNAKAQSDSILSGLSLVKGQMAEMLKMRAKAMVSPESLKGMIEGFTAILPGKEVKIGDKWENHITITSDGFSTLIVNSGKLKKITGNVAEIACDGTTEPANQNPMEIGGMQISSDLRGAIKGTTTVDTKTGWIIKNSSKNNAVGTMSMKMGGNDMSMPMEVNGTVEIIGLP